MAYLSSSAVIFYAQLVGLVCIIQYQDAGTWHHHEFIKMQGAEIARFEKKVFEKPFESTAVKTIEQKLRESKSTKRESLFTLPTKWISYLHTSNATAT